jgi:hypothetical protein
MIANFLIDSRYGGPHVYLNSLKKKLYKQKFIDIYQDKKLRNINLYNLKKFHKLLYILDTILNIITIYFLFKKKKKINVFFIFSILNIAPVIANLFLKKKIYWFILEQSNYLTKLIFKFLLKLMNITPIFITKSLAKEIKIKNYKIFFPVINYNFWRKNKENKENKEKKNKIIMTSVGNINKTKNHLQLINFLENIRFPFKFYIVGKALLNQKNYYDMIKKKISLINKNQNSNIKILQDKKHIDIKRVLNFTDIYILPSKSEGLSLSLVEAMSMECICLVSNPSNHSKLIKNGYNGFTFDLNLGSFLNKINKIKFLKKNEYKKISKNALLTSRNLCRNNYNFKDLSN